MLTVIKILHNLFTVVWIGGIVTLGFVTMPAAKKFFEDSQQRQKFMNTVEKRMQPLVQTSIVVLLVTGVLLARNSENFLGLFSFGNVYSGLLAAKHIIFLLMILILVFRGKGINKLKKLQDSAKEKIKVKLFVANLSLGIVVVVLSSITSMVK